VARQTQDRDSPHRDLPDRITNLACEIVQFRIGTAPALSVVSDRSHTTAIKKGGRDENGNRIRHVDTGVLRPRVGATGVGRTHSHGVNLRSMNSGASPASRYVTYFMLPGNSSGNAAVDRQLSVEVEMALANKGLVQASPEQAEAVVVLPSGKNPT
jgi:hypothetical protein